MKRPVQCGIQDAVIGVCGSCHLVSKLMQMLDIFVVELWDCQRRGKWLEYCPQRIGFIHVVRVEFDDVAGASFVECDEPIHLEPFQSVANGYAARRQACGQVRLGKALATPKAA